MSFSPKKISFVSGREIGQEKVTSIQVGVEAIQSWALVLWGTSVFQFIIYFRIQSFMVPNENLAFARVPFSRT